MSSQDEFLMGGGSKSAKFDNVGDSITGQVVKTQVTQQTKLGSGEPLFWDNNNEPRMQLVVTLQTALRDDVEDDGLRNVYVKGSKKAGSRSLHDAVRAAVEASGAKGLEPGGTLTVQHIGTEPSATVGYNDRKLFAAQYVKPDQAAASGGFLTGQPTVTPGAVPQVAQADPWQIAGAVPAAQAPAAAPAAAPGQPTQEQIAAVRASGMDPATVWPQLATVEPPF
jgi:hypothetical protein